MNWYYCLHLKELSGIHFATFVDGNANNNI